MPADSYHVRVAADAIASASDGTALDGELDWPDDPDSLPSGDGKVGGDAWLEFPEE